MAQLTPLHHRTAKLCTSLRWKDWAGYHAVCSYDTGLEFEYSAIRNRAALLDVSPLFKHRVRGPGAAALLDRLVPRDVTRCRVGQVLYTPWCDPTGKTLDDGTVQRLGENEFRLTSALPHLRWLQSLAEGLDVELSDESAEIGALALQGPCSRSILQALGVTGIAQLRYFRLLRGQLAGHPVEVSRTGYTGDLGFEIWVGAAAAPEVWDALLEGGEPYGITPAGLDVLDVARLEAGLILMDVDYHSARLAAVESRKSSPFEIGLGWAVNPRKKAPYVGREALLEERKRGSPWALVGLEVDWPEVRALYEAEGLPPGMAPGTQRSSVPVYARGEQVGYATSHGWSPILKKSIALATVESRHAAPGTELKIETTVEHRRHRVAARVVPRPFFDPPRKTATPA